MLITQRKLAFAGALLAGLTALLVGGGRRPAANPQIPAPPLTWEDWVPVGLACSGVQYYAAISKDDGRNEFELKLKVKNRNKHAVQTRFEAEVESADGIIKQYNQAGSIRLNTGRSAAACSRYPTLCLGMPFPPAADQRTPTQITRLTLTSVEVIPIGARASNTAPNAYLAPYRGYPPARCTNLTVSFDSELPNFVRLTDRCVGRLPRWTKPACNDAVDEIVKAYRAATDPAEQDCLKEWRKYQKCYEIYAFETHPTPTPACRRPICQIKMK